MNYQRARLQYQFNKLSRIREGVYPEYGGNIEFELYSFFEICYHLKDWIKHDSEYSIFSNVEHFIDDSPALRICADICNRLKHRNLRTKRSKLELGVFMLHSTMIIGTDPSIAKVSLDEARILTERGNECCFELASECLKEWTRYFHDNGVHSA